MVMMRNDKRVSGSPVPPAKKLGEAAGQAAAEIGGKIAGDDLKLGKQGPSAAELNAAFDRVAAAEKRVKATSMGTLGAMPQFEKALKELSDAKADLEGLRQQDPKLYDKVSGQREEAKEKASKGFWDNLKSAGLFVASPGLWVVSKIFGIKF